MNIKQVFKKASENNWAIPQFNFSTLEQLKGITLAAKKLKSPIILGTSENEAKYLGLQEAVSLVNIARWKNGIFAILHLDHARDPDLIKTAIDLGYDSVHFDGSHLKLSENIKEASEITKYAHKKDVFVEGEIDAIIGESKLHNKTITIKKEHFTSPEEIKEFTSKTKIDSLAVSIGSFHGVWKQQKKIDFDLLKKIKEETNTFLVLHGGSDISSLTLKKAVKLGIRKVNFNTELRIAWKNSLLKSLQSQNEFKPYNILPKTILAVQKKSEEKISLLGSRNRL